MSGATPEAEGVDPAVLRDRFFDLWNRKEVEALRLVASQSFGEMAEPLDGLLTILEGCPGIQKGRSQTLGHCIVIEFQLWRKEHPTVTLGSVPGQQQVARLQSRALALLTDAGSAFMDHLLDIYQVKSLDPARLRLHIIKLQALKCYREAALLSTKLKLQDELDMEEMCIPLILQDKLPLAEAYVSGYPQLEQRLVTLLDSWCRPGFTVAQILDRFPRLCLSKHHVDLIHTKMLSKHVFRLMEKYNVNPALCPNSVFKRRQDSLRFLMYKRFVEKGMSEENWSDHVQSTVGEDAELQVTLVELVMKYCDLQSACQWSLRYSVPKDRLPFGVWEAQQDIPSGLKQECVTDSAQSEEWVPPQSHRDRFYQVPITWDQVHFLDTQDGLQRCRDSVLKAGVVVGVDMEWRAGFGYVSAQRVALIQLAVPHHVFLLDLCANGFCQHQDTVSFIRTLFSDKNILKLGYGMAGDLKCILGTWPQFAQEPLKLEGMLDLLNLHPQVQRSGVCRAARGPRGVLVGEEAPVEKGLSLLVQQVLGRPLDKMEQLSNWERRPLRTSQIRYAAADAYCLLDVYTALSSDPARFGLPADLRSVRSHQSQKSKEQKKQKDKAAKRTKQPKEEHQRDPGDLASPSGPGKSPLHGESVCERPPMAPQQLRVVCDNMLQGLGRYLRCLGVDVLMLGNTDDHRVAAQLAQAESRVILTCGQPYQTLRSQVGEGRCLFLDCSEKARDQAIRVLRHFNVQPTHRDIFSRCQACNGDQYMRVPREDMARMLRERGFLQDEPTDHTEVNSHQQEGEEPGDVLTSGLTPDLPRYAPQCRWAPTSALDPDALTFPGGATLQLHTVPPGLLPRVHLFYVCTNCGKVFWEGSHFSRVLSQFQDVLHITEEDTSLTTVAMAMAKQN